MTLNRQSRIKKDFTYAILLMTNLKNPQKSANSYNVRTFSVIEQ